MQRVPSREEHQIIIIGGGLAGLTCDYPMGCANQYGDFLGELRLGRPLVEAIWKALRRNAAWMLAPPGELPTGTDGMRILAEDFAAWGESEDWSWAARFGYQVIIKRGCGGSFFRSLEADFLKEAAGLVPAIAESELPERMSSIAARWRALAAVFEEQSERKVCNPELFAEAGRITAELADHEESFFREVGELVTGRVA